jgi:hypothetical protein
MQSSGLSQQKTVLLTPVKKKSHSGRNKPLPVIQPERPGQG